MATETGGDALALAAQHLDRFEVVALPRADPFGLAEQRIGQYVLHFHEGTGQRHQHGLSNLLKQLWVTTGELFGQRVDRHVRATAEAVETAADWEMRVPNGRRCPPIAVPDGRL